MADLIDKAIFQLDSRGYTVLRNVVDADTINRCEQLIRQQLHNVQKGYKFNFFHTDPIFMKLMQLAPVLAICERVLGDNFRMDHAFGTRQLAGKGHRMHGGAFSGNNMHNWISRRRNPICQGQLSLSIPLVEQGGNGGGVAFLPGSHHSHVQGTSGNAVVKDLFDNKVNRQDFDCPTLIPGDVIIFPESVIHGSCDWTRSYDRWSLLFMYTPGHTAWKKWDDSYFKHATTPLEKRLLRPPCVGDFDQTGLTFNNVHPGRTRSKQSFAYRPKNELD